MLYRAMTVTADEQPSEACRTTDFSHADYVADRCFEDNGYGDVECECERHGWTSCLFGECQKCFDEWEDRLRELESEQSDAPAWGQEDTSEAEAERRKADWDKYWI